MLPRRPRAAASTLCSSTARAWAAGPGTRRRPAAAAGGAHVPGLHQAAAGPPRVAARRGPRRACRPQPRRRERRAGRRDVPGQGLRRGVPLRLHAGLHGAAVARAGKGEAITQQSARFERFRSWCVTVHVSFS
ncbi:Methylesterase 3 [Zea mays]|uniref:Methylesterase 3 n=1 Tax=Zea mays TaxID=4577 RepID=A0A1D6N9N1_MAIZE|nr:Methylesterase 3 [Zea mays]